MYYIVLSFCEKNKISLEITPTSSSSCFSLKNTTIKDKETNTSSNSKTQSYIKKTTTEIKMDESKQSLHNSIGFRKNNITQKLTVNLNNSVTNSNKKNENKQQHHNTNTKLYEKLKKKAQNNYLKKNNEKKSYLYSGKTTKRESLGNKMGSTKLNRYNNLTRKRKNTVKSINNTNLEFKFSGENNNNQDKDKERRHSSSAIHRPILSLDDISTSYNEMKEKRNKIIKKFKKDKISRKEQAFYILSTSPVLRLCEQLIFANTKNIKQVLSIDNVLKNHNIFLNAKANELQNEISLCEKTINTPFIASKIADITLNFITSVDEQEFKDFDILEINKDEINNYYNYIKLLYILFNDNYDNKISGKILKTKLFEKVKEKGFSCLRDYLYYFFIENNEEINIVSKIEIINNEIIKNSPNLLNFQETLKICRFTAFTNYLIKEVISYANNINDMFELKYRAKNLLDIVLDKIDKIQNKNENIKVKEKK